MNTFFKVSLEKQDYRYEMKKEHYHNYYEFYYLLHGSRRMFLNNKVYSLHDGDMVAINKGAIHRTTYLIEQGAAILNCERIVIAFSDDYVRDFIDMIGNEQFLSAFTDGKITIPEKKRAYFEDLLLRILEEDKYKDTFSALLCKKYCEEMMLFLLRYGNVTTSEVDESRLVVDHEMEAAVVYINEHFKDEIDLHNMALRANMSQSHFSKRFKKAIGFGFKEYLNTVRIKYACELLTSTDMTITEISEKCGYMDSNYFGDAFRKMKGVSPRDYRKENSN